jgi:hypothetical protein
VKLRLVLVAAITVVAGGCVSVGPLSSTTPATSPVVGLPSTVPSVSTSFGPPPTANLPTPPAIPTQTGAATAAPTVAVTVAPTTAPTVAPSIAPTTAPTPITSTPTSTEPAGSPVGADVVVFQDDFDDFTSGWETRDDADATVG